MNIIKEYKIVREVGVEDVEKSVRHSINEGWQPIGGITIVMLSMSGEQTPIFAQAMVKYS